MPAAPSAGSPARGSPTSACCSCARRSPTCAPTRTKTAPVVFRAEQNVLLELAESATSLATTATPGWVKVRHRDGQAGLRAHRAGLRPLAIAHDRRVAVLGAGAWGTAIAGHLAARTTAKPSVTLWARDAGHASGPRRRPARTIATCPALRCRPASTSRPTLRPLPRQISCWSRPRSPRCPNWRSACSTPAAASPLVWLSKGFVAAPDCAGR